MKTFDVGGAWSLYHGDAHMVLSGLPTGSAHACVTSPPYWRLRDYGEMGQLGQEATPEEYVQGLTTVFEEVRRVLRDDGTLWVVIGDTYITNRMPLSASGYQPKELVGIPWMLAFSLRATGWMLRQEVIWHKPNAIPESTHDRCTRSHETVFMFSKSPTYYYDQNAIKEPVSDRTVFSKVSDPKARQTGRKYTSKPDIFQRTKSLGMYAYRTHRNRRSVWSVPTKKFKEAHFAVFPLELVTPCVLASAPVGGVVLDPFAGSGTTGVAALLNGREFVGIDLSESSLEIAKRRLLEAEVQQLRFDI